MWFSMSLTNTLRVQSKKENERSEASSNLAEMCNRRRSSSPSDVNFASAYVAVCYGVV